MKNLETTEVRGISIKQLTTYVIAAVSFIVALVVRDVKRENKIEEIKTQIEVLQKQIEIAEKDRATLKVIDDQQNERLIKLETKLEYLNDRR